jgi:hypothetical protein
MTWYISVLRANETEAYSHITGDCDACLSAFAYFQ